MWLRPQLKDFWLSWFPCPVAIFLKPCFYLNTKPSQMEQLEVCLSFFRISSAETLN